MISILNNNSKQNTEKEELKYVLPSKYDKRILSKRMYMIMIHDFIILFPFKERTSVKRFLNFALLTAAFMSLRGALGTCV